MKKPEIMCPIRDWSSLEACKDYADAVYFGVSDLSLRANANAIKSGELEKFVKKCHGYKIKAYLTVNSVIYNDDLQKAEALIKKAKSAKVDAVIVWDPAIIDLARKYKLTFFISTQANVSNWKTAEFYKKLGAKRVVVAREMSLKQIKEMTKNTKIEVESFVHGAMCMAISGRCVLSSYLYGTSANCGYCAQPCRKEWILSDPEGNQVAVEGKYFLSAKDLCMIEYVPELIKAGIMSFKIEGRRRDPRYIQTTARCYKEAVDSYFDGTYTKDKVKKWKEDLLGVYNRGYSTGFYFSKPGKEGISYEKADNASVVKKVLAGVVVHYYQKIGVAEIYLNHGDLKIGDSIAVEGPHTYLEQKVCSMEIENKKVEKGAKGERVALRVDKKVLKNSNVFVLKG